jgi:hypothetical protein
VDLSQSWYSMGYEFAVCMVKCVSQEIENVHCESGRWQMILNKKEKELLWSILYSVRDCWNEDGKLVDDYYNNVILPVLTEAQKAIFHSLVYDKLFH